MKKVVLFSALMVSTLIHAVNYEVVPMPQQITLQQGEPFVLNREVQILAADGLQREAEFLQSYFQEQTGLLLSISQKREKQVNYIELAVSSKEQEKEGYVLSVNKKNILIEGGSAAGGVLWCSDAAKGIG